MGNLIVLRDVFENAVASFKSDVVERRPIEEVMKDLRRVDPLLKLVEKSDARSLNNVLGIIEGPYFVPDGKSRNKRFYPRALWERVIREEGASIERRGRLGTLEHPDKPEDEHPRQASHVLKKLWIKGSLGYGKSYVLRTPIGAVVSAIFSATDEHGKPVVPIYVSSRALGRYLPDAVHEGMPVVDPDSFVFQTFDIVVNPGFLEANPEFIATVEACIGEVCEASKASPKFFVPDAKKPRDNLHEKSSSSPNVPTGNLQRLNEELTQLREHVRLLERELNEKNASLLSIRFGISRERSHKLLNMMSYEEAVEFLASEVSNNEDDGDLDVMIESSSGDASDPLLYSVAKRLSGGGL